MRNLLCFMALVLSLVLNAQKNKLSDFKLVAYDITAKHVSILSYSTIDINGVLKVYIDKSNTGLDFYSYQLTNEEIEKVNQLSSGKLQSFVARKELKKNMHYAGNRNFLSFQNKRNEEKLCFIQPFMNTKFNEIIDLLEEKIYKQDESAKAPEFEIDFENIKKEILKQNEINNYLPQKELPPPTMR